MTTETQANIRDIPLEDRDDIIVCENVYKWFGSFCAVNDVSMKVKRGEVVVIFGPSGIRQIDIHPHDQPN